MYTPPHPLLPVNKSQVYYTKLKVIFLLSCLILAGNISAYGEDHSKVLKVLLKDGSSTSYALDHDTKITFANASMLFSNKNWKFEIPVENLTKWTYETSSSTSISPIEREITLKQTGDLLKISGINADTEIFVFTVDGKLIRNLKSTSENTEIITSDWLPGIYLIRIGKSTYKIIKS